MHKSKQKMSSLNFPTYSFRIKTTDGKKYIFDRIRKKFVALQPEEWVRQNMIEFLIAEKNYPETLIGNEVSLVYNNLQRRCDSVIYSTAGKPLMIIEYKAPTVEISQNTFDQICVYNKELNVDFLLISNGLQHYCCKVDNDRNQLFFLQEIPDYEKIIQCD